MTARAKRLTVIGTVLGLAVVYFQIATWFERRVIDAQRPAIRDGSGQRYVDRDRLMADVMLLASSRMGGRRTGTPGGLAAREWIASQFRTIATPIAR